MVIAATRGSQPAFLAAGSLTGRVSVADGPACNHVAEKSTSSICLCPGPRGANTRASATICRPQFWAAGGKERKQSRGALEIAEPACAALRERNNGSFHLAPKKLFRGRLVRFDGNCWGKKKLQEGLIQRQKGRRKKKRGGRGKREFLRRSKMPRKIKGRAGAKIRFGHAPIRQLGVTFIVVADGT